MELKNIEVSFLYGDTPEAEREEIMRNVRTILRTPVGTCPLYRDFGIDISIMVDYPIGTAQNIAAVEIIEKVEKYEPRAKVTEVSFHADTDGQLRAKAVIRIE